MKFQSVLIVASICIIVKMAGAEITINDMEPMLKMLDTNRRSNSLSSMDQRDSLLRKKRSTLLSVEKGLAVNEIDLKEINNMLPIEIGHIDSEGTIKKRHARRNHHDRWNHSHLENENNNNNEKVKRRDSSEESEEVNTEDPSHTVSAENVYKKQNEEEVPAKQKNDRRRKNHSKHEDRDKDFESKNVKHNENNEAENKKRKDSGEEADNKEFIFVDLPKEISANKENKRRKDRNNRHDHRDEK